MKKFNTFSGWWPYQDLCNVDQSQADPILAEWYLLGCSVDPFKQKGFLLKPKNFRHSAYTMYLMA